MDQSRSRGKADKNKLNKDYYVKINTIQTWIWVRIYKKELSQLRKLKFKGK